jgi:phage head-tail adaptor, putative, SPP1 family
MNPGQLNSRIELKHLIKEDDESGGYEEKYETYASVWAKVVNKTAKKEWEAEEEVSFADFEITIRFRRDTLYTDRIVFGDRVFEQIATAIDIMEKHRYLKILVREADK